jgi:hypothetical protein
MSNQLVPVVLPRVVGLVTPPAPRNNFDVAGFVLLGAAALAFLIGGAVAANGGRS